MSQATGEAAFLRQEVLAHVAMTEEVIALCSERDTAAKLLNGATENMGADSPEAMICLDKLGDLEIELAGAVRRCDMAGEALRRMRERGVGDPQTQWWRCRPRHKSSGSVPSSWVAAIGRSAANGVANGVANGMIAAAL